METKDDTEIQNMFSSKPCFNDSGCLANRMLPLQGERPKAKARRQRK
jgi:hypothetical protein